jgi:hypothetical protein
MSVHQAHNIPWHLLVKVYKNFGKVANDHEQGRKVITEPLRFFLRKIVDVLYEFAATENQKIADVKIPVALNISDNARVNALKDIGNAYTCGSAYASHYIDEIRKTIIEDDEQTLPKLAFARKDLRGLEWNCLHASTTQCFDTGLGLMLCNAYALYTSINLCHAMDCKWPQIHFKNQQFLVRAKNHVRYSAYAMSDISQDLGLPMDKNPKYWFQIGEWISYDHEPAPFENDETAKLVLAHLFRVIYRIVAFLDPQKKHAEKILVLLEPVHHQVFPKKMFKYYDNYLFNPEDMV